MHQQTTCYKLYSGKERTFLEVWSLEVLVVKGTNTKISCASKQTGMLEWNEKSQDVTTMLVVTPRDHILSCGNIVKSEVYVLILVLQFCTQTFVQIGKEQTISCVFKILNYLVLLDDRCMNWNLMFANYNIGATVYLANKVDFTVIRSVTSLDLHSRDKCWGQLEE